MKKFAIILILLTLITPINAEKNIRKSISGPDKVYILNQKPKHLELAQKYEYELINSFKHNIEMPRFDINNLPQFVFENFDNELKGKTINETTLTTIFKKTVAPEIQKILNDPDIQRQRINKLKEGNEKITFAETKGKSNNVLSKDLEIILNSAFIYFPYIHKFDTRTEKTLVETKLQGGILWFQVTDDGHGNKDVKLIRHLRERGNRSLPIDRESLDYLRDGRKEYVRKLKEISQIDAIQDLWQKLKAKTKKIENFKVLSQVVANDGSTYEIDFGTEEGVELDDTYWLMDRIEDEEGEHIRKVGFVYITKVADNEKDPKARSKAKQLLGDLQSYGGWVKEYPRSKTQVGFSLGSINGIFLDASEISQLQSTGQSAIIGTLTIAQNLAPLLGKSQLFGELALSGGFVQTRLDTDSTGLPLLGSAYLNLKKKYWHRTKGAFWKIGIGMDSFYLNGETTANGEPIAYGYQLNSTGLLLGGGFEKLLSPNLSLVLSIEQKISLGISSAKIKNDESEDELTLSEISDQFENTTLGGTQIQFGINYNLP